MMQLFSNIKEKLTEYVDTKLKLFQMDIEDRASELLSNLVYMLALISVFMVGFLFLLMFLTNIINHLLGNSFAGYGIMASLCVALLLFLSREKQQVFITRRIKEKIITTIKKQENGDQNSHGI